IGGIEMKRNYLLLPLLALVLIGSSFLGNPLRPKSAEAAFSAYDVNVISQQCLPNGSVEVSLNWSPSSLGLQSPDLSMIDNGFFPGPFVSFGQVAPQQSTLTWTGLMPGRLHFLRVNTLTPFGWMPSDRIAFVTRADCTAALPSINLGALNLISQQCLP